MPRFVCELVDPLGRSIETAREAASEAEAIALFAGGERFLVSIREDSRRSRRRKPARAEETRELTAMLGSLLESGLSLGDSLSVAAGAAREGSGARRVLEALRESIEKGSSLSRALEDCGGFSKFYRGMVAVGERLGAPESVLPRLAAYLAEREALRDKLLGALAYPALVLALALIGAAGIFAFLLPRLLAVLEGLGGEAAIRARESAASMTRAACLAGVALVILAALVAAFAFLRRRDESFAVKIDALALRLPVAGPFLSALDSLGFASAMETLAAGGLPVEEGMREAAGLVGNRAFRAAIGRCREFALKGEPLSRAAARCPELPPRFAQWLAIGERSGRVDLVFGQLRKHYRAEADRKCARLASLAEPVLVALVGGAVLALLLALVVPLFSMYGAML